MTGARLYPLHCRNWILELASKYHAILVTADYQLLPESNGQALLDDIADLFDWIHRDLQSLLNAHGPAKVDLDHLMVVGESAGGYMGMQAALQRPNEVRIVATQYPMLDLHSRFFSERFSKPLMGYDMLPNELVDDHVKQATSVVSNSVPPSRRELAVAIIQNGRLPGFLGSDQDLYPLNMISKAPVVPPVYILHGQDDNAVPVDGSQSFVQDLKAHRPDTPATLVVRPGGHGFDHGVSIETPWFKNSVDFIVKHWLGQQ